MSLGPCAFMDVFDPAYICNLTIRVKLADTPTYKVRQFFYKLISFWNQSNTMLTVTID